MSEQLSEAETDATSTSDALAVVLEANLPTFVAGHTKIVGALRRCDKAWWREAVWGFLGSRMGSWRASIAETTAAAFAFWRRDAKRNEPKQQRTAQETETHVRRSVFMRETESEDCGH